MVAFGAGWELAGRGPSDLAQATFLAVLAAAIGAQSAAVRRLGQMSTTYLTSTLAGLIESVAARPWTRAQQRILGIIAAVVIAIAAATIVAAHGRPWLPLVPILPLLGVIIASRRTIKRAK